jgi:hypothetical protein
VAYLDDDAIACSTWLEKICEVFRTVCPRPGMVGGRIELLWEAPRPNWMPDSCLVCYGYLNVSQTPASSNNDLIVFGGNAAYPKSLLADIGGFDHRVGRKGKSLVSNDETQLWHAIKQRGYQAVYHPEILIHHHVPVARLNQRFLLRRLFWQGVSDVISESINQRPALKSRGARVANLTRTVLMRARRISNFIFAAETSDQFEKRCDYAYKLGTAWGLLKSLTCLKVL